MFHNKDLNFIEETHIYYDDIGELTSVGNVIKNYINNFNPDENLLNKLAIKNNVSVNKLLKKWETEKNNSIIRGKKIHNTQEDYFNYLINNNLINFFDSLQLDELTILNKIIDCIPSLNLTDIEIYAEQKIADHEWRLSGTADLLIKNKKNIFIYDYKTNKKIDFENKWRKMKLPFENYDDSKYNQYKLQLSLYGTMLFKKGFNISAMGLIWINHDGKVQKIEFEKDMLYYLINNYRKFKLN